MTLWGTRQILSAALFALVAAGVGHFWPSAAEARSVNPVYRAPIIPGGDHFSLGIANPPMASTVCERIGALADRLGETYAGHRMRAALVEQKCPLTHAASAGKVWDWPWRAFDSTAVASATEDIVVGNDELLPPELRRETGAWQIRCGQAATRERCALTRREGDQTTRMVAHFIVDRVAGKSAVLFRLFTPRPFGTPSAAVIELPEGPVRIPFATCSLRGCILEASPAQSSIILGRLWDNRRLEVRFDAASKAEASSAGELVAIGFRDGFKELLRLDREDRRLGSGH